MNETNSVAIDDASDWAQTLADPNELSVRGKNARRLAEEQFSFDLMAARYEALYREVTAQKP